MNYVATISGCMTNVSDIFSKHKLGGWVWLRNENFIYLYICPLLTLKAIVY